MRKYGTRPYSKWVQAQGCSPDTPSGHKKCLGYRRHSLEGGLQPSVTAPWGSRNGSVQNYMDATAERSRQSRQTVSTEQISPKTIQSRPNRLS